MIKVLNPAKLFILGFDGLKPSIEFRQLIRETPPAGFLLLGHNYDNPEQLCNLTASLKEACGGKAILSADQEPGRVQRFKEGFPLSKKPSHYLRQGSLAEFRAWCSSTADMMASMGLNMNLAPVVDLIASADDNHFLKDRAFGNDPDRVSEYANTLIEEFKVRKIATCVKHFPGLGCGTGDPHEILTRSTESLERFLDYHWRPFKSAVRAGVDCVMTTHIMAPAIDSESCATYSKNAIGHLRNTIGHRGPIISDDLNMAGANAGRSFGRAVEDSLCAGHNLLILSKNIEMQNLAIESIRRRYSEDEYFRKIAMDNMKLVDAFIDVL